MLPNVKRKAPPMIPHEHTTTPLTEERVAEEFGRLTADRPAIRPDIAELIEKHSPEIEHYKTSGPYVPQTNPVPVKEPVPGWMKGTALMAPAIGGGTWLAMAGVEGVMNAASVELAVCLGIGGIAVAAISRATARRGPRKVVNHYRGATIDKRVVKGIVWKSNNRGGS